MNNLEHNLMRAIQVFSTLLIVVFIATPAQGQTTAGATKNSHSDASSDLANRVSFRPLDLSAQARPARRVGFLLMPSSTYSNTNVNSLNVTAVARAASPPAVLGSGTVGQISLWAMTAPSGNSILGDSIITQFNGNIGIGLATPTSKLTVEGMIETTIGGYKFPDGTIQTTAGISFVTHDSSLAGMGTPASPLGIAPGGVQTIHLANGAVTSAKIANGAVGTTQLADGSVTAGKIGSGQVVKSLNSLKDDVTLAKGAGIDITPSGNTLTISTTGVLTSVEHDSSLTGNGTGGAPLAVASPIKAMVYVDPTLTNKIVHCYNSQLTGSAATTPPCGFQYSEGEKIGEYFIDFPFQVSDRFVSITPFVLREVEGINFDGWRMVVANKACNHPCIIDPNSIFLKIRYVDDNTNTAARFHLVVF